MEDFKDRHPLKILAGMVDIHKALSRSAVEKGKNPLTALPHEASRIKNKADALIYDA